jgi:hypothetical protein
MRYYGALLVEARMVVDGNFISDTPSTTSVMNATEEIGRQSVKGEIDGRT